MQEIQIEIKLALGTGLGANPIIHIGCPLTRYEY